jgi:hypothetical protein
MLTIVRLPWPRPPLSSSSLCSPSSPNFSLFLSTVTQSTTSDGLIDWLTVSRTLHLSVEECQNAWTLHELHVRSSGGVPLVSESQEFPAADELANAIEQAINLELPNEQTILSDSESSLSSIEEIQNK